MCEKSIHHMETNKGNNVTLAEWHSCSPVTGPAAASRPTCCHLQPHADPPGSYPQPPHLLLPSADFTPRKQGLESQACRLGTAFIIQWPHASGFLRYWRLPDYEGEKKKIGRDAPLPPAASLKKLCPLPRLTKALPSCCHFNMRAPLQKKKASGTRLSNKDS